MDGVKIQRLLPKKWLMKSLAWQQNRHQKVFYRLMGLYIWAVALDILQFEKTSLCFIFKFGGKAWSFVSEGLSRDAVDIFSKHILWVSGKRDWKKGEMF